MTDGAQLKAEAEQARYLLAVDQAHHDYEMAWLVFGALFVGQTVLLGFIGLGLAANPAPSHWEFVIAASLGIAVWLPWFFSFQRNAATMQVFRVHQAWAMEPAGWEFLDGAGRDFAEGRQAALNLPDGTGKRKPVCFKMPLRGRIRTRHGVTFLQIVTLLPYLVLVWAVLGGKVGT